MSFLSAYRAYFKKATDASDEFCEASALMALGTITLGYRWIARGSGIRPNLFMMLIAHSSRDRKSTSVEMTQEFVNAIAPKRVGPEDWTPEGLISMLRKRKGGLARNRLLLPMPEFGEHLARMRKQFGSDMNAVLCKVYDGKDFTRVRSGKRPIEIKKPRVSLFGGVAYAMMEKHGDKTDWDTGLYARMLWITPRNRREMFSTQPPTPDFEKRVALDELSKVHSTLKNTPNPMAVSSQAEQVYSTFVAGLPEEQPTTAHSAQRERLINALWKLAIVYQVDIDPMADVGAQAMQQACAFAQHAWEGFCLAYGVCCDSELDRTINRLWKRVTEAGEAGIGRRDLHRATNIAVSQFDPAIRVLCQMKYVREAPIGKTTGYKVIVPYEERA